MLCKGFLEPLLFLSTVSLGFGSPVSDQIVISSSPNDPQSAVPQHGIDSAISAVVKKHADPVSAYLALYPHAAEELAEPRLLHIFGEEEPEWMTMGDKMRLRRKSIKYMDVTGYQDGYEKQVKSLAGKASK
jgi:bacterial leucyl aminopeptidase